MLNQINYLLDDKTKDEALDLVAQADAKLALPSNLPIGGKKRQNMGQASAGYVDDCIGAAKAFPTLPSGAISIEVMMQKMAVAKGLDDVAAKVLAFYLRIQNVRRLLGQDLMADGNSIKESFERVYDSMVETRPTTEKLRQRYAKAQKEDEAADKQEQKDGLPQ